MISLWERQSFLENDLIIIGGGLVGLSVASSVLEKFPSKKVLILEKGILPFGASTKNAGFLCTDSFTEFLHDIGEMGESSALNLFLQRVSGMEKLISRLGAQNCDYKKQGSYELISDEKHFSQEKLIYVNNLLFPFFKRNVFLERNDLISQFGFNSSHVKYILENVLEGQIDTGKTVKSLYQHAVSKGAVYLTGSEYKGYTRDKEGRIQIEIAGVKQLEEQQKLYFKCKELVLCTNGFTNDILEQKENLTPGRGQVILTKPIQNLPFKGTFHFDEGFYYFRDFYGRVLFGGGRNQDFKNEETNQIANTHKIVQHLKDILVKVILPNQKVEIEQVWAGIMCFTKHGTSKNPLIKKIDQNVYLAVRMNGMGVALSSNVGEQITAILYSGQPLPQL